MVACTVPNGKLVRPAPQARIAPLGVDDRVTLWATSPKAVVVTRSVSVTAVTFPRVDANVGPVTVIVVNAPPPAIEPVVGSTLNPVVPSTAAVHVSDAVPLFVSLSVCVRP